MVYKWVGNKYEGKRYRTQREAAAARVAFSLPGRPVRVDFVFEIAWVLFDFQTMATVFPGDGRRLIGYYDPYMPTYGDRDVEDFGRALIEKQIAARD